MSGYPRVPNQDLYDSTKQKGDNPDAWKLILIWIAVIVFIIIPFLTQGV